MSLFSNLYTASSGLNVASTSMSIIGDNIANVNTIGFKKSRASFADAFPNAVGYIHGAIQIGTGAYVNKTTSLFGQGTLQSSDNTLDMALNGNGFFAIRDENSLYYTRNGEFFLDSDGHLVNGAGLRVQGYTANDEGYIQPSLGDIQVALGGVNNATTTEVNMTANIDAEADDSTTPVASMSLDGLTETIDSVTQEADYSTSISIFDSLGDKHDLTIVFEKNGTNSWDYSVLADAGEIADPSAIGYASEFAFSVASGSLTFNTDGEMTGFTQNNTSLVTSWNFEGAAAQDLTFDFGLDTANNPTDNAPGITQLASSSTVTSIDQDGFGVGNLSTLRVTADGIIIGLYDNGQDQQMGQVTIATFNTTNGMERVGGTLFRAQRIPGEPSFGVAGEGGRGDVFGSNLETANVDIEQEFINMITAQRSYQANSRVLSATNELLRELVNLV